MTQGKAPKFDDFGPGYGLALACAGCGDACGLHHDKIDVFECEPDAQKDGVHVSIDHLNGIEIDRNMSENPSTRRHGLKIRFWCELCPALTSLTIAQHKGQTFFNCYVCGRNPEKRGEFL